MARLIFLDVDGVLNREADSIVHAEGWLPDPSDVMEQELIQNLKFIVDAAGAEIVVSSSWRHFKDAYRILLAALWTHGLRVRDRTPGGLGKRGDQVKAWLAGEDGEPSYVILDDHDDFLPAQRPHFVHTDPAQGLTLADARAAIQILLN